jgi:CheY-like chemotaxis protein
MRPSATSLRYASYLLDDELRQSPDDLTRMARTYVVTGDDRCERIRLPPWRSRAARRPRSRARRRHVTSEPGRGTTFTVDVPIGGPAASSAAPVSEDVAPAATADILVVDDEAEVGDLVRELLAAAGHRVEVAANGVKALECLHERAYDVIISDMRMPELDGPGLYRAVQRWRPALCRRFVFMTGDALGSETTAFLEPMRTLHKPFRPREIHDAVGDVLAGAGTSVSFPAA